MKKNVLFLTAVVVLFSAAWWMKPVHVEAKTIGDAKILFEQNDLHCRELFKATNPILIVSTRPLTEEQAIEFTGPVGRSRTPDAVMVVPLLGQHNIDPSIAVRVGEFQLVGDAKLIERIAADLSSR